MTKFIKLSNAAQDGSIYIDPDFIGMISRNRDADTFIRFKDGSYAHVCEMPNEVVEMISGNPDRTPYVQLAGRFTRPTKLTEGFELP